MARLKKRLQMYKHAFWHIMHGLFPNWEYAEDRVDTPNFDHIDPGVGFEGTGYWKHLRENWRCSVRHRIMARYPYLEVRIK